MATFERLYKVITDSPVGYQTINQFAENQQELKDRLAAEHGTAGFEKLPLLQRGGPPVGFDYKGLGRHNAQEIARTVGAVQLTLSPTATIGVQLAWAGPGIPLVWKIGTGDYLLPVVGVTNFWAHVPPFGSATIVYLPPQVRPFFPSAANGNNTGIRVRCFKLDAGDFVPADSAFFLTLYGEV